VRLALGSGRAELWRLVLRQALVGVVAGLVVSVPAAFAALKLLGHWLPNVSDVTLASALPAVGVLALAAAIAAAVPAIHAARLDPIVALRSE